MKTGGYGALLAAMALVSVETTAVAQQAAPGGGVYLADSVSPFGAPKIAASEAAVMPDLAFTPTATDAADFDKYYVFHRADTDVATAYADIAECDGYARGLQSGVAYQQAPYPYTGTMAGAVGGAIGNVMAVMIFGSAEKRRLRRVNMRTCMHYKGYDRFGMPKAVWEKFNFEEGLSGVSEEKRQVYLKQQAMVAASSALQGKALGL